MSGNRKRLTPENRRAVIVEAALKVFAEAGYDRASMRAVAQEAGITTPVLYDHFDSKAALYAALVESEADSLIDHWEQSGLAVPDGSAEDMFLATIDTIFDWVSANEAGWRIIFLDSPSDPAVAEAHRTRQERATRVLTGQFARMDRLYVSGPLNRERTNEFVAEASKWAVNAIAAWWWNNKDLTRDQIALMTHNLLWHGLNYVTGERS